MQTALPTAPRRGFDTVGPNQAGAGGDAPRLRLVDRSDSPRNEPPAAETDAQLFSISRREARCQRILGRLASAFLKIRGYRRLGFVRLDDFSRERLGLSGREVQSLASVAGRLEKLPSIAGAFECGELSFSQTRLLVAVAGPDSEADWLGRGRGITVRGLASEIRAARAAGGTVPGLRPADPVLLEQALDEESGAIDGEESVRFRVRCPTRIASLWRHAVELARRMLGEQAAAWKAAEAIAAEGASAAPLLHLPHTEDSPILPQGSSASSAIARPAPVGILPSPEASRPRYAEPDWDRVGVPAEEAKLATLARSLDGLDAFDLDERMREVVRFLREIDARVGSLLRRVLDLRLHRRLGFESVDSYVQERLGMSPSRARTLVLIERRAVETRELAQAWHGGELSWMRALTILPVVAGRFSAEWVARAGEVTVRRLRDEVEWELAVRERSGGVAVGPPAADLPLTLPDLQMCARPLNGIDEIADREVTFRGPASVVGLFRASLSAFMEPAEPPWKGFERLLTHAIGEWEAQPRHRDPIFERDGWRCTVPACSARRDLHDHHRRYRSCGGGNQRWNRTSVCWQHHDGIHEGLVRAHGRAPDELVWELGLRPGREALLVFRGDRYVRGL